MMFLERFAAPIIIFLVSEVSASECQCDDVLRPMFWHDFMPSYLTCQADLVCLLTRMRWMTAKGEINDGQEQAMGAISTFRKANSEWLASTHLEEDLRKYGCYFEASARFGLGKEQIAIRFLHCLQAVLQPYLCEGCIDHYWNHFLPRLIL